MSKPMTLDMVLAGPYAGRTMAINGKQFVDGRCRVTAPGDLIANTVAYLARYQAYPVGSPALAVAQKRDEERRVAAEEKVNGSGDTISPAAEPNATNSLLGDAGAAGAGAAQGQGVRLDGVADPAAGDTGLRPEGDGHEDPGLPEQPGQSDAERAGSVQVDIRIHEAVMKLDPEADSHWTEEGLPKLSVVEEALGSGGVTRLDVQAAAPDWTRDKAMAKATADL